jgi:hypothetical protein
VTDIDRRPLASRYLSDWWNIITWLNYGLFAYNMMQFFAVGAKVHTIRESA